MCGRYTLAGTLDEIAAAFCADDTNDGLWPWEGSYNIAPAAIVPVIALNGQGRRAVVPMRWGLHPHWSKSMPEGRPMFNARSETAADKPSFRTPWKRRRALIPFDGWYEWEGVETPKQPYYIYESEQAGSSAFAGLWDQYRVDEGITLLSATILTTAATGDMKHLHHRMPVRLPRELWDAWLEPDAKPDALIAHKLGSEDLAWHTVSRAVNSGRASGAELIEKITASNSDVL